MASESPMQGVETSDTSFKKPAEPSPVSIEKQQEQLLRSKYGNIKMQPKSGSSLLQQRLANKGTKYFDSGDYNMAKAKKGGGAKKLPMEAKEVTGDHMATPDEIPRVRKPSHSKLALY